ncbi:MAG TPA: ThiF family adenylyltransferase [Vineibacter sp.]|nr:ThiF family adenylyltransferase [Vineibacter sp.]
MAHHVESSHDHVPNGATRLLAIVGDPIAQVRAPAFWSAVFRARGMDRLCIPIHAAPADLSRAVDGLKALRNLDGIIVTVPHKAAALEHVDRLSPAATRIGAINVMRPEADGTWSGDMFDGIGFVAGLAANGIAVAERTVLLVGAGGAGTAIAVALADAGVRMITVFDADRRRALALRDKLAARDGPDVHAAEVPDPADVDLAINATPLGMRPTDNLPLLVDRLRPDTVVADVIMKPMRTPLLEAAARRGCRTHTGVHMMDHQAPLFADFFRLPAQDWSVAAIRRLIDNKPTPGGYR